MLSVSSDVKIEMADRIGVSVNAIRVQILAESKRFSAKGQEDFLVYCHEVISELKAFFTHLSADQKEAYVSAQSNTAIPACIAFRRITDTDLNQRWMKFRDAAQIETDWSRLVPIRTIPSIKHIQFIEEQLFYDLFLTHNMSWEAQRLMCVVICVALLDNNSLKLAEKSQVTGLSWSQEASSDLPSSRWQSFRDGVVPNSEITGFYATYGCLDGAQWASFSYQESQNNIEKAIETH